MQAGGFTKMIRADANSPPYGISARVFAAYRGYYDARRQCSENVTVILLKAPDRLDDASSASIVQVDRSVEEVK